MASRPPTVRSLYRSVPPPEPTLPEEPAPPDEPVAELPPVELAAIAVMEPVIEPAPMPTSDVVEPVVTTAEKPVVADVIPPIVSASDLLGETVEPAVPPPALEIISLERIDRSQLPARGSRTWRYSLSRWAYRWWLWTQEAFRHCFPTSKQH